MELKNKVIDSHLHIEAWENEEGDVTTSFEPYKVERELKAVNVCGLPSHNGAGNNIMCLFYKLANPDNTYVHGGIVHLDKPITDTPPAGFDTVTQYRELMEIGCDGIKMLEGKPSYHLTLGSDINVPSLDRLYTEIEKDGTHLVYHINDPDEFWDRERAPKNAFEEGWFYGDLGYAPYEEIQRQAEIVFERHPNIKVTLAHFFFNAKNPEYLEDLFKKYPNLCIDITPGTEMYHAFESNHEFYREFFTKYSDRIVLGTDGTFPWATRFHSWCCHTLLRFLSTDEKMMAFNDEYLTGLNLPEEAVLNIVGGNFERRVSNKPKPINKAAFKKYIEKYWFSLCDEDKERIEPLVKKYL
ncbi:MAG: hypothetical protein IKC74_05980 [Clostridia bacterium]|nr:hypothetical protein [Clostridia bacterium]